MSRKLPPRAGENLRRALAQEAARVMAEHGVRDFLFAKRKAAERFGVVDGAVLPRNSEIEEALAEYQRLFGGGVGAPAQPAHSAGPPPAPSFGGATQSFQAPQMHAPPPAAAPAGPSEFTRMFSAPQDPQLQQQAAPPQPAPPPPAKPASPKWPIFLFAGVFLIIIVAVVVLLIRG